MTYPVEERAAIIQRVLTGLSEGTPLAVICREDGMPDRTTIWDWEQMDSRLSQRIARAREDGHDMIAWRTRQVARGKGESTGDVQRDRLICEQDNKLLAKWGPKRYGDKTLVGSDPENPLPPGFAVNLVRSQ